MREVIISTTNGTELGFVLEHVSVISKTVVRATHGGKDIVSAVKDIFGGRVSALEGLFAKAQAEAVEEAKTQARSVGGDAIIGVTYEYSTLGEKGGIFAVHLNGTIVKFKSNVESLARSAVKCADVVPVSLTESKPSAVNNDVRKMRFGEFHQEQKVNESQEPRFVGFGDIVKK